MNPGPVEEVGKAANTFMDVMRQQPLSLALVVMNLALLALFWYIGDIVAKTREREINQLHAEQKEVRELLAKCVVPPRVNFPSWLPLGYESKEVEQK